MIKEFVEAWDKNKDKLEDYFRNTKQREYDKYKDIVEKLFRIVINPYLDSSEIEYPLSERV